MESNDIQHTRDRVNQFRRQAGDSREAFEKKILLRAQKSSSSKNEVTALVLEEQGDKELARLVRMSQVLKEVQ